MEHPRVGVAFPWVELNSLRRKARAFCLVLDMALMLVPLVLSHQGDWRGPLRSTGFATLSLFSAPRERDCMLLGQPRNRFALFCVNKQISWRGFLGELGTRPEESKRKQESRRPRGNRPGQRWRRRSLGLRSRAERCLRPSPLLHHSRLQSRDLRP